MRNLITVLVLSSLLALPKAVAQPNSAGNLGQLPLWEEIQKLTASDGTSADNFGTSAAVDGDTAVIGSVVGSAAYVFDRNQGGADNWGEVAKLTASDAGVFDLFGWTVAIDGDTVIVGALSNDGEGVDAGAAYIYERNEGGTGNWGEVTKLTAADTAAGDALGSSVAIHGDIVVVGASGEAEGGTDAGATYVFDRNQGGAGNWGEVTKLTASDAAMDDAFGSSVAVHGDVAVVGATGDDDGGNSSGAAYIFERNQGGTDNWGEVTKLTASDAGPEDDFGNSAAIDRDTVIVGAFANVFFSTGNGAAYVFERNQGGADNWGEATKLTASDAAMGDEFGRSVAICGDTIIVGSGLDDDAGTASGSAYVFERNEGGADNWGELIKLTASDAAAGDELGFSVGVAKGTIVVGARFDDDSGNASGSAYVFNDTRRIFADGFESGDTSAWSNVLPAARNAG